MWTRRESETTCLDLLNLMAQMKTPNSSGGLVHWEMCNNLLTITNKYPAIQASRDFNISYGKLRRVISGVRQHGGSYYERQCQEQEGMESGRKHKAVNPVNTALARKRG